MKLIKECTVDVSYCSEEEEKLYEGGLIKSFKFYLLKRNFIKSLVGKEANVNNIYNAFKDSKFYDIETEDLKLELPNKIDIVEKGKKKNPKVKRSFYIFYKLK